MNYYLYSKYWYIFEPGWNQALMDVKIKAKRLIDCTAMLHRCVLVSEADCQQLISDGED